ncbi:MAG TPA: UDP-3-O-acyl-N-acetylglucosamine deacetylase [Gemmataceae bacterium]|nr:UDP-3-O-acyl-N-acetylglucosamine deacetylase [Gemmataceae bacterium]
MRRLSYRYQRTIARPAAVQGIGLLTGADVHLRFLPAPPSHGVVFVRTDLTPPVQIPARVDNVTGTQRRTTLGRPPAHVALVEHVLAALAGLRIDNCRVELNAPEPPGLDGSAYRFVEALRGAGAVLQPARRAVWGVATPVVVAQNGATLALHPAEDDNLTISYLLNYGPDAPIGWQIHTQTITPENFANNLAACRTFLLDHEAAELRRQGLGARTTVADLVVFGPHGPLANRLRYADEPARHKVLDIVGDLALFGADLRGHVVGYRSGHPLNVELVRVLSRRLAEGCPTRAAA